MSGHLEDFTDDTVAFWQPRTRRELSREDARQIIENASGFFRVLLDWDARERRGQQDEDKLRDEAPGTETALADAADGELPESPTSSKLIEKRRESAADEEHGVSHGPWKDDLRSGF